MAARILDGNKIGNRIKKAVGRDVKDIRLRKRHTLKLVALQIGANPSSEIYLNVQRRLAEDVGVRYNVRTLRADSSQKAIEREIAKLNKDNTVTGIIIHAPIPEHMNLERLFARVSPEKDIEGLNHANIGRLIYKKFEIAPCSASACMALIDSTGINLRGKEAVIVGHSEIVGKPLSLMLLSRMATTTVCHIGTYEKGNLKGHVRRAEVLIVSVGKRHLIKGSWIRKGAVVIDVGINRYKGAIYGDVDFNAAKKRASYITPVPGGVGPLTAVILMKNLVTLYKESVE